MSDTGDLPDGGADKVVESETPFKKVRKKALSLIERVISGKKEVIADVTSGKVGHLTRPLVSQTVDDAALDQERVDTFLPGPRNEHSDGATQEHGNSRSADENEKETGLAAHDAPNADTADVADNIIVSGQNGATVATVEASKRKEGRTPPLRLDHGQVRSWYVVGASTVGAHHSEQGEPCEDAWAFTETETGIAVAIVSDGAGSATHSGFASQFVANGVTTIANMLAAEMSFPSEPRPALLRQSRRIIRKALANIRNNLIEAAKAEAHNPDDYLSTVVGVVAHRDAGALLFHIGDGAASVFDDSGQAIATSQPENGEYDNETYFLVEDIWMRHFRCRYVRPTNRHGVSRSAIRDILLMSDGGVDIAYDRKGRLREPVAAFVRPVTAALAREPQDRAEQLLAGTLMSESASVRSDDDKTVLWIRPRNDVA